MRKDGIMLQEMRTMAVGDIVAHFKRELLSEEQKKEDKNQYLYVIEGFATHSETRERMVVYRALYGEYGLYVRPYSMFMSEVDKNKYPMVQTKYRFTLYKTKKTP